MLSALKSTSSTVGQKTGVGVSVRQRPDARNLAAIIDESSLRLLKSRTVWWVRRTLDAMDREPPQLYATPRNDSTLEVRHLLILRVEGELRLLELSGGAEKFLGTGTPYEMRQKAQLIV